MTPNLFFLYFSSVSLICLLGLFARHNKKTGWVRHRAAFAEDLAQLQSHWSEAGQSVRRDISQAPSHSLDILNRPFEAPVAIEDSLSEINGFSSQLSNLQSALKSAGPQVTTELPVAIHEDVAQ